MKTGVKQLRREATKNRPCCGDIHCQCPGCAEFWLRVKLADRGLSRREFDLWVEAYKSAHVCADLTEKIANGEEPSYTKIAWLRDEASSIVEAARELKKLSLRKLKPNKP